MLVSESAAAPRLVRTRLERCTQLLERKAATHGLHEQQANSC
jgi:hypothetical protein